MSTGTDAIINFILDAKNKQIRDLIELAIEGNDRALNYIDFISNEIKKKFSEISDANSVLPICRLSVEIDPKKGQKELRQINKNLKFHFDKYGKLSTINDETDAKNGDNNENESVSYIEYIDKLQKCVLKYLFFILTSNYKFRSKNIGMKLNKGNKKIKKKIDFEYKTLLFSKSFDAADSIVIMIAPKRALISYPSLILEQGIAYGTMIPYIDDIMKLNTETKHKWGVLVMDPQGKDANNNKYSIIKIFDKWLSKRIPTLGLFKSLGIVKKDTHANMNNDDSKGNEHPKHKRRDSDDESIISSISTVTDGTPKRCDIKNLFIVGALNNGQWISHLMHRRGVEMQNVIKGCIFIGADDPYDVSESTEIIYKKTARNWVNSGLQIDTKLEGKKLNGEDFIIQRVSAGNTKYCVTSAQKSVINFMKNQINNGGDQRIKMVSTDQIQKQTN